MLIEKILNVDSDIDVSGIGFGDRCNKGDLYFCLHEGERLVADMIFAESRGAAAVVYPAGERRRAANHFSSENVRRDFAIASSAFYGYPAEKLTMIGVTGTNGKTTVTHIIAGILKEAGHCVGLIGTNGASCNGKEYDCQLTTPDPPDLHRILAQMLEDGADSVVMEVSAHSLALDKLAGIRFAVAAFTNLTQDHLDFFETMEEYRTAKLSLFTPAHAHIGVVNVDDETGMRIFRNAEIPLVTYGCDNPSDVFAIDYVSDENGCSFVTNLMDDIVNMEYCAPGRYNMSNVLCAAAVSKVLGIETDAIARGVMNMRGVAGRFKVIRGKGKRVVIDYAHTPDGLDKALRAVREITEGKVITVFGCGGNRDKTKRAAMGEIASELSDFAVITSDNPRNEPPSDIIRDIAQGVHGNNYVTEANRRAGIKYALDMCKEGDTVLIAGKGNEETQEICGVKQRFSDEETVRELLK